LGAQEKLRCEAMGHEHRTEYQKARNDIIHVHNPRLAGFCSMQNSLSQGRYETDAGGGQSLRQNVGTKVASTE